MTLLDFLRMTRANLLLLILGILLGAGVGLGYGLVQPKTYTATSTGYVTVAGSQGIGEILSGDTAAQNKAEAYVPLIKSGRVAQKIAEKKELSMSPSAIQGSLDATVVAGTAQLQVTARAQSPQEAVTLANNSLQAAADVVSEIEGGNSAVHVIPLDDAQAPTSPVSPDLNRLTISGAAIGLVIAYLVVFARRFLDVKIRTTKELEKAAGAGVLGTLPKSESFDKNKILEDHADHQSQEALRQLRTNLRFVSVDNPPKSIIVTSPNPGEGKSTVASSLAYAFAHSGQPTILIDADLRRPTVAKIFGLDDSVGLTQLLSGQVELADAVQRIGTSSLYVLPAGRIPPNPSELLGSAKMRQLIKDLSEDHFVLVDVPPLLPVTDGSLLSTAVDGTILVTALGSTRKDQAEHASQMLTKVKANLLGTVLNKTPTKGFGSNYYGFGYGGYQTGYHSYYGQDNKKSRRGRKS